MKKSRIFFILLFVSITIFSFSGVAHASRLNEVQVSNVVGSQNAEVLSQTLDVLSSVLSEINLMISRGEIQGKSAIVMSNALDSIKSTLVSVDDNVTELAYKYVNNMANVPDNNDNNNGATVNNTNENNIVVADGQNNNELANVSKFSTSVVVGMSVIILIIITLIYIFNVGKKEKRGIGNIKLAAENLLKFKKDVKSFKPERTESNNSSHKNIV